MALSLTVSSTPGLRFSPSRSWSRARNNKSSENLDVRARTCARDTGVGGNDCGVHMKIPADPAPPPALMPPPAPPSYPLAALAAGEGLRSAVTVACLGSEMGRCKETGAGWQRWRRRRQLRKQRSIHQPFYTRASTVHTSGRPSTHERS